MIIDSIATFNGVTEKVIFYNYNDFLKIFFMQYFCAGSICLQIFILHSSLKIVVNETDFFGGVNLLNSRDALSQIRKEVEGWTDSALNMFGRHRGNDNKIHQEQISMDELNKVT